jgi:hypothetical protein
MTRLGARFGFVPGHLPSLDEIGINGAVIGLVVTLAMSGGALIAAVCLATTRPGAAGSMISALGDRSAIQADPPRWVATTPRGLGPRARIRVETTAGPSPATGMPRPITSGPWASR